MSCYTTIPKVGDVVYVVNPSRFIVKLYVTHVITGSAKQAFVRLSKNKDAELFADDSLMVDWHTESPAGDLPEYMEGSFGKITLHKTLAAAYDEILGIIEKDVKGMMADAYDTLWRHVMERDEKNGDGQMCKEYGQRIRDFVKAELAGIQMRDRFVDSLRHDGCVDKKDEVNE